MITHRRAMASVPEGRAGSEQCRICGGYTIRLLTNEKFDGGDGEPELTYDVGECKVCGLIFIDPEPNQDVLSRLYDDEYGCYQSEKNSWTSWKFRVAEWRFAGFGRKRTGTDRVRRAVAAGIEAITGRRISFTMGIPLTLPKEANILEVGYGAGDWLIALRKKGYRNLWGVDISSKNVERLTESGIQVATGNILALPLAERYFDLIRLEHCFEHLIAPSQYMRRLGSLLRPGGMVVMTVPNRDSMNMNCFLEHSGLWQMPYHVYHWGEKSIGVLAAQNGFTVAQVRTLPVLEQITTSISQRFGWRMPPSMWSSVKLVIGPIYAAICNIVDKGDFLSLILRKDERASATDK